MIPQVGEFWCFTGLGRDFFYVILDTTEDPDYIILGTMGGDEPQTITEYRNSFTRRNKWKRID